MLLLINVSSTWEPPFLQRLIDCEYGDGGPEAPHQRTGQVGRRKDSSAIVLTLPSRQAILLSSLQWRRALSPASWGLSIVTKTCPDSRLFRDGVASSFGAAWVPLRALSAVLGAAICRDMPLYAGR
jgi:hypothetical protein